ncbi:response regulator [Roseibium sp.]|uniref:response regulator n=1 Tax=Roseibium sp. TaxID=1936156 RepID=UPI0032669E5C
MIKALYVDDDEDIASIVELCLDLDDAFEARCLNSGKDALVEAVEWQPDVILLDYMMPDMDGPTTFTHLKKTGATRDIPVVFVTAKSMQEDVDLLLELGAIGVISKPFDPISLASDIRNLLQG